MKQVFHLDQESHSLSLFVDRQNSDDASVCMDCVELCRDDRRPSSRSGGCSRRQRLCFAAIWLLLTFVAAIDLGFHLTLRHRYYSRQRRAAAFKYLKCGYPLHRLATNRCPECGTLFLARGG